MSGDMILNLDVDDARDLASRLRAAARSAERTRGTYWAAQGLAGVGRVTFRIERSANDGKLEFRKLVGPASAALRRGTRG